jgi:hypothetical protein
MVRPVLKVRPDHRDLWVQPAPPALTVPKGLRVRLGQQVRLAQLVRKVRSVQLVPPEQTAWAS